MPTRTYIADLPEHIGDEVTISGWVMTTRSSGKIAFIVLRDGTGYLQWVLGRSDTDE
jgi:asparaginyl-tRNA synthetase